ncbi:MAG: cold shock domain-containing protein [Cellvibrionaceae bacterium]
MNDRSKGTVKWFNNARGYGFITSGEHNDDIFVHYRNIRGEGFRSLSEGQQVEFAMQEGEKGLQAEDVVSV